MINYKHILSQTAFTLSNNTVLEYIGNYKANALYTYLVDKHYYFSTNKMITYIDNKAYFFNVTEDIQNHTILTSTDIRNAITLLSKLGMIETKLKGIPAKRYFCIIFSKLDDIFSQPTKETTSQQDVKEFDNLPLDNLTSITIKKRTINNNTIKIREEEEYIKIKEISNPILPTKEQVKNVALIKKNEVYEVLITKHKNDVIDKFYLMANCIDNDDDIYSIDHEIFDLYSENDNKDVTGHIKDLLEDTYTKVLKKELRVLQKELDVPSVKSRANLVTYFQSLGKIQVSRHLFMYSYEILLLKMIYTAKYLSDTVTEIDNYYDNEVKYRQYTSHFSSFKFWLKKGTEKFTDTDRYKYYNYGVSRNDYL